MYKLINAVLTGIAVFCCCVVPMIGIGMMLWDSHKENVERRKRRF